MNYKNLLVVLIFTVASFLSIHTTASASTNFSDIKQSDYFYKQVQYLVEQNIISGYKSGDKTLFKPNQLVTRAEVATMVVRAKKQSNLEVAINTFKDVPSSAWYADNVNRAVQLGYMDGIGGSTTEFKPNDPVSRQEMTKILFKVFNLDFEKYEALSLPFVDVEKNIYYKYIAAVYYNGYGAGESATKFNPRSNVTRATFSVFMARGLNSSFKLPIPVEKVKVSATDKVIGQVKVNTNGLNVRASADFSQSANNKLGTLSVNTVVDYFEEASSYYKINYNGYYGYIYKTYANIVTESVTKPTTPPSSNVSGSTVGYATVNSLNVRAEASDSASILGKLNRGDKVTVQSVSGNWAKVTFNNRTGYVFKSYLKLKNTSGSVLKNRIIILDPGHGGRDSGAVSKDKKTLEKNIVLTVSNKVKALLEANGAIVYATRTTDVFPSLDERVAFAKNKFGEVFVSIHVNSATNTTAKGTETYHSKSGDNELQDEKLATFINDEIVKNAQMKNRTVKREDYKVIKNLVMPSVLVELGFISNDEDLAKLRNNTYLDIYARSIYNGIVKYYSN